MMRITTISLLLCAAFLSSCASTKTKGCDMSATDSCLTMDAVNAMTEEKGVYARKKAFPLNTRAYNEKLWIAPLDKEQSHA